MDIVTIYTDGSCLGNPGPGGWGAIITMNATQWEICGRESYTTNNQMELTAAIRALEFVGKSVSKMKVYTDSNYVKNGITKWISGWKQNGWKNANNKAVKNKGLWIALDNLCFRQDIEWNWVKGHSEDCMNQRVDRLAHEQASLEFQSN